MNWNELFFYNNGKLHCRNKLGRRERGAEVGTRLTLGYLVGKTKHVTYYVHRIIWEMHNGPIPQGLLVDHINHIRDDNRIENLRLVTRRDNAKNAKLYANNSSGVTGVRWDSQLGKWYAYIQTETGLLSLGLFGHKENAIKARKEAEVKFGFHENHGK